MRKHFTKLVCLCLAFVGGVADAAPTNCPRFFAGGQAPDFRFAGLAEHGHALCFSFYSVVESGVSRTALWSAEHLTRESVAAAHLQQRVDAFHPESSISREDRAEREDFLGSGKDEGHMSPSGDMPDERSQYESFSLGNMIPQSPDNNRHLWQGIEISTRALAKYDGELYVVTGPAFIGGRSWVGGRVEVPTHVWKAIYDPKRGAAAYITLNRPGKAYAVISIAELTRIVGIDPFPAVPQSTKETGIALPRPRPGGQKLLSGQVPEDALGLGAADQVSNLIGPIVTVTGETGRARERPNYGYGEGRIARTILRALSY